MAAGTITSSPGSTPTARSAIAIASVPDATPTASRAPQNAANARSNSSTRGPSTNRPPSSTDAIAASSSRAVRRDLARELEERDVHGSPQ